MTISFAWYESRWTIFTLEIEINGLLFDPFAHIMLVILQDFPLSTFLTVCCFNQGHHPFHSMIMTRDLRCTDRRTRNQNSDFSFWRLFSEVTSTALPETRPLSDTIREVLQLKNILYLALTYIKIFWRSLTHILIYF